MVIALKYKLQMTTFPVYNCPQILMQRNKVTPYMDGNKMWIWFFQGPWVVSCSPTASSSACSCQIGVVPHLWEFGSSLIALHSDEGLEIHTKSPAFLLPSNFTISAKLFSELPPNWNKMSDLLFTSNCALYEIVYLLGKEISGKTNFLISP
jgi:hypothetical protein